MTALDNIRQQALRLWNGFLGLFADEDPQEPFYDPVHLGGVCLVCMVVIGGLYWLLWTLLVYEGGIFVKLRAGLAVLLTPRTLKDFGYEGAPYAMGAFAGWVGNVTALGLCMLLIWALFRLYRAARQVSAEPDA